MDADEAAASPTVERSRNASGGAGSRRPMRHEGSTRLPSDLTRLGTYFVPTVVQGLVPLLALPAFTRYLTPRDFGVWGIASGAAAVAFSIVNLGMPFAYERDFFRCSTARDHSDLLYSTLALAHVLTATVLCLLFFSSGLTLSALGVSPGDAVPVLVVFTTVGLTQLKEYFLVSLKSRGMAGKYVRYSMDQVIIGTALSVVLVVGARMGLLGYVLGPLVATAYAFTLLWVRYLRELRPTFSVSRLRGVLEVALPLLPRLVAGGVTKNLDKLILGNLASVDGVGIYAIAQRITAGVDGALSAARNVFGRRVYTKMFELRDRDDGTIGRLLQPFFDVSILLSVGAVLFADELILALTTPEFYGAVPVVVLLVLRAGAGFFGRVPQLMFAKKTAVISAISVAHLGIWFPLMYLGSAIGGPVGAAGAALASGLILEAANFGFGQRAFKISWPWARMWSRIVALVLIGAYAAGVGRLGLAPWIGLGADITLFSLLALWLLRGDMMKQFVASGTD